MCQDVVLLVVWRSVVAYGVVGSVYSLSDNIFAEISIQRWTFCQDIVLLVVWGGVVNNKIVNCFGFKSVFLIMILNNLVN